MRAAGIPIGAPSHCQLAVTRIAASRPAQQPRLEGWASRRDSPRPVGYQLALRRIANWPFRQNAASRARIRAAASAPDYGWAASAAHRADPDRPTTTEGLRHTHRPGDTTGMILIGVCGGIAAYKTCELVRMLVRAGHEVQVVQTPDSQRFVGPTTFAALSRRPVLVDGGPEVFPHLDASAHADLLCIAPLSATTLSRISHGEAANVLTATTLAFAGPDRRRPGDEPAHVGIGCDDRQPAAAGRSRRRAGRAGARRHGGGRGRRGEDGRAGRDLRGDRRPARRRPAASPACACS